MNPLLAQNQDINNSNINSPGFRLSNCDGPVIPDTLSAQVREQIIPTSDAKFQEMYGHPRPYVACDFPGFIGLAQHLINIMIIMGVVVAIIGIAYGGWLYVTGTQENIKKAKSIFPKLAIGFILMLTAWFIVSQIMIWLTGNAAYMGTGQ